MGAAGGGAWVQMSGAGSWAFPLPQPAFNPPPTPLPQPLLPTPPCQARDLAEDYGVKVFTADIIYHLFDKFKQHLKDLNDERKLKEGKAANFPCVLQVRP